MTNQQTITELRENCECEKNKYCPLEVIVLNHGSNRLYLQHKIVEIVKYEVSFNEGKDIGWEKAYEMYVKEGYAKIFSDVYKEGMKCQDIYRKMRELIKNGQIQ